MHRSISMLCLLFFGLPILVQAKYTVKGTVNFLDDWQPTIYLAAIDKLDKLTDYYRTSADLVVNVAPIQADGSFILTGDNLPTESRFYRLYLLKEENREYETCLFVGVNDHNFIHLILQNDSQLEIIADKAAYSPFGNYQINGDGENQAMRQLADIIYPSFDFYKFQFQTERKFSEERLHQNLKYFSDTCRYPIVSLAAVVNTDLDHYFETDRYFYEDFGDRLKKELSHSSYTKNYFRKLHYYGFEETTTLPNWVFWSIGLLALSFLIMSGVAFYFYKKSVTNNSATTPKVSTETVADLYDKLTLKEREILALIKAGKANKEIASQLFIGVSTVKSHINKIYSKLEVRSRKEVVSKIRHL